MITNVKEIQLYNDERPMIKNTPLMNLVKLYRKALETLYLIVRM